MKIILKGKKVSEIPQTNNASNFEFRLGPLICSGMVAEVSHKNDYFFKYKAKNAEFRKSISKYWRYGSSDRQTFRPVLFSQTKFIGPAFIKMLNISRNQQKHI